MDPRVSDDVHPSPAAWMLPMRDEDSASPPPRSAQVIMRRTKIVATLGPASSSPDVVRQLIQAGMDVARLNFSHGSHDDHARQIATLRALSRELDTPVTILQDLQGPKIRIGQLPGGAITLSPQE